MINMNDDMRLLLLLAEPVDHDQPQRYIRVCDLLESLSRIIRIVDDHAFHDDSGLERRSPNRLNAIMSTIVAKTLQTVALSENGYVPQGVCAWNGSERDLLTALGRAAWDKGFDQYIVSQEDMLFVLLRLCERLPAVVHTRNPPRCLLTIMSMVAEAHVTFAHDPNVVCVQNRQRLLSMLVFHIRLLCREHETVMDASWVREAVMVFDHMGC